MDLEGALKTFFALALYALGIITVNIFTEQLPAYFPSKAMELAVLTLAVFLLSASFFGRAGFVLMFFAGMAIGSNFSGNEIYAVAAILPLLLAVAGGSKMGKNAFLDLAGKKNFFDESTEYVSYAIASLALAVIIGLLSGFFPPLSA